MKQLTKQQFLAALKDPKLFAARKKIRRLRKELAKINWRVYSKHISKCAHPRLILEVLCIGSSGDSLGIGDAAFTVGKAFSFSEHDIQYLYNSSPDQFRVIIIL